MISKDLKDLVKFCRRNGIKKINRINHAGFSYDIEFSDLAMFPDPLPSKKFKPPAVTDDSTSIDEQSLLSDEEIMFFSSAPIIPNLEG